MNGTAHTYPEAARLLCRILKTMQLIDPSVTLEGLGEALDDLAEQEWPVTCTLPNRDTSVEVQVLVSVVKVRSSRFASRVQIGDQWVCAYCELPKEEGWHIICIRM